MSWWQTSWRRSKTKRTKKASRALDASLAPREASHARHPASQAGRSPSTSVACSVCSVDSRRQRGQAQSRRGVSRRPLFFAGKSRSPAGRSRRQARPVAWNAGPRRALGSANESRLAPQRHLLGRPFSCSRPVDDGTGASRARLRTCKPPKARTNATPRRRPIFERHLVSRLGGISTIAAIRLVLAQRPRSRSTSRRSGANLAPFVGLEATWPDLTRRNASTRELTPLSFRP
jgi:hypothetical protein